MSNNEWERPANPPPPLFTGQKEKDFVKQVNDELVERVIGQTILYYPIDLSRTNFHPLYGEAIDKTFLNPIRVHALVEWEGSETNTSISVLDNIATINIGFHKRRLTEDQNLYVREGDFVVYGDRYYEITTLAEPRELFGQPGSRLEIAAVAKRARKGLFNAIAEK